METNAALPVQPWLNAIGSRYFLDWLQQQRCSLAFTTYQTGKLFFVGRKSASGAGVPVGETDQALSVFERTFNHCMGMCATPDGRTIWLSSRYQIWRMEQAPANVVPYRPAEGTTTDGDDANQPPQWIGRGYDVAYIPRVGYTTGHIDVHDMGIDADGCLIFVNTMFGCLATFGQRANLKPLWRLPFLSALVSEDRCHLNGLAIRDGRPGFVTVVSRSDVADGWRDKRHDGGCVLGMSAADFRSTREIVRKSAVTTKLTRLANLSRRKRCRVWSSHRDSTKSWQFVVGLDDSTHRVFEKLAGHYKAAASVLVSSLRPDSSPPAGLPCRRRPAGYANPPTRSHAAYAVLLVRKPAAQVELTACELHFQFLGDGIGHVRQICLTTVVK